MLFASVLTWLPPDASTTARYVDDLFYFILYLCIFFFVLIISMMVWFVVRYRRRSPDQKTSPISGNHSLEIAWSVIPGILLVMIFVWGFRDYIRLRVPPRSALDVRVTAAKWTWTFTYPNEGIITPELVVPVGRPVKLTMSSVDVIHSFFVPQFRVKQDVLPYRYSTLWFEPTLLGTYQVFCTEYCGTGHSTMLSQVKVVTELEYQEWINSGGGMSGKGMTPVEFGKFLFKKQGCATCHSTDGTPLTGPTFFGLFGRKENLADGSAVLVDDNYIRESVMEPNTKVVKGFAPLMPTFKGRLPDKQMDAIIDYIKSIGVDAKPPNKEPGL